MWRLIRPDAKRAWGDPEVVRRLSRYRDIIDQKRTAKYLIAKSQSCEIDLDSSSEELWRVHAEDSQKFTELVKSVDRSDEVPGPVSTLERNFLNLKIELAHRILADCHFCERRCGADRTRDEKGWCKLGTTSRVSSAFLHSGEEAPLVPSGTIFFASCCFGCVFCQNDDISTNPNSGQPAGPEKVASIAEALFRQGGLNINYVGGDPIPNTHTIIASLVHQTSNVTQLWNSNLYCSEETMRLLVDIFDVWLPDFKYGNNECAKRLSGVENYFNVVSRNHLMAYNYGEVIVRHLVMPNHLECCTIPILEWIAEHMPNCMVNIMGQYRPTHRVPRERERFSDIARPVTSQEMDLAFTKADELGVYHQYVS